MRPRFLQGITIKAALVLGFGATFAVWLFAGLHFAQRVEEVQREAASVNERYNRAQDLLSTVRAQVLLGSVFVRDALLDPDPATTDAYRRQLEATYQAADGALGRYVPVLGSQAERERVVALRREIVDFRATSLDVLATDRSQWPTQARLLLSRRIMPKRDTVLRVSDEVQALNRSSFIQQQTVVAGIYEATQRRVWQRLGFALGASLVIALIATMYVSRLEHDLHRQRSTELQNTQDLQRLSAKLITAQEEERRTIARELHDEVGQVLSALKVELAIAQRALETNGGSGQLLEDARSITDGALTTVRDLSHLLHPALLDDLGLPAAIDWYLNGFNRRHRIRVELLHERMDDRLVPEIEAAAYRIVQEALTNVVKHANATACRVYVQRLPNTILITVEDDGTGFDPGRARQAQPRGLGLIGIRERVSFLRGTVRLESAPGKGTRLTVELPARVRTIASEFDAPDAAVAVTPEVLLG